MGQIGGAEAKKGGCFIGELGRSLGCALPELQSLCLEFALGSSSVFPLFAVFLFFLPLGKILLLKQIN